MDLLGGHYLHMHSLDLPKPVVVRARQVDMTNRVASAIHHSIETKDQLWLMVPLTEEQAREIVEVSIYSQFQTKYLKVTDKP